MASGEIETIAGRSLDEDELVDNPKLNDLSVPRLRVKENAITFRELADGAITADKLDLKMETPHAIADNAVTTAKLGDNAVTTAKLAGGLTLKDPRIYPLLPSGAVSYRPAGVIWADPVQHVFTNPSAATLTYQAPIPAGILATDGSQLRCTFVVNSTGTGSNTLQIYCIGSSGSVLPYNATHPAAGNFYFEVHAMRRTANYTICQSQMIVDGISSQTGGPVDAFHAVASVMGFHLYLRGATQTFYCNWACLEYIPPL